MSSIAISGDTSGAITISAPAISGTNTLTLPALTGNIITSADTGTVTKSMVSTSTSTGFGLCRAWVNFAGSTGTIAGSFNVSSITRNATGYYTINMTTAMPSTAYAVSGSNSGATGTATTFFTPFTNTSGAYVAPTTSSFTMCAYAYGPQTFYDPSLASVIVHSS